MIRRWALEVTWGGIPAQTVSPLPVGKSLIDVSWENSSTCFTESLWRWVARWPGHRLSVQTLRVPRALLVLSVQVLILWVRSHVFRCFLVGRSIQSFQHCANWMPDLKCFVLKNPCIFNTFQEYKNGNKKPCAYLLSLSHPSSLSGSFLMMETFLTLEFKKIFFFSLFSHSSFFTMMSHFTFPIELSSRCSLLCLVFLAWYLNAYLEKDFQATGQNHTWFVCVSI